MSTQPPRVTSPKKKSHHKDKGKKKKKPKDKKKHLLKSGRQWDLLRSGGVERPISRKDFKELKMIGRGSVGKVYLVKLRGTEEVYAMKVLNKEEMIRKNKVKRVMTEREILATADHPFIVTLHWCWQSQQSIFFVMDFCSGGEFFRILKGMPDHCLPEDHVRFYMAEVLVALEYLHILGFIYRDLKPENILLHASGHLMLTDFDLAKQQEGPVAAKAVQSMFGGEVKVNSKPDIVSNSFVGTAEYIAPEVISGFGHSSAVDWWTFGVLMYEMLYGNSPFKGKSRDEIFAKIQGGRFQFPSTRVVSKDAKNLMKRLLVLDQKKRLGAENGAADLKAHAFFKDKINWALIRNQRPPVIPKINPVDEDADGEDEDEEDDQWGDADMPDANSEDSDKPADVFSEFKNVTKKKNAPSKSELQDNYDNE